MGFLAVTDEFSSAVPAEKLFQAFALDFENLMPKILPQAIKSIERISGDGGPGTIMKMNIIEGGVDKYVMNRIDALDKEKLTYSYTVIEGDVLGDMIESISYVVKLEASPDGGSKGTNVSKYYPKSGAEINESAIKEGKAKAMGAFKVLEAYLIANPGV